MKTNVFSVENQINMRGKYLLLYFEYCICFNDTIEKLNKLILNRIPKLDRNNLQIVYENNFKKNTKFSYF